MRILLKNTTDIEKVKHIIDKSSVYFYKAHVEVVSNNVYVVFDVLERK
jgi:hypothetical protein